MRAPCRLLDWPSAGTPGSRSSSTTSSTVANRSSCGSLGGAALWELTSRFAIEGTGRWMDRGSHPDAYAGELAILLGLAGTRDTYVPYVTAGVGIHRRTFDVQADTDLSIVPSFYRRRLGAATPQLGLRRSFTDPTLVLGTGVDVALSRTVVLRPDVRLLAVFSGGRRDNVIVASLSVGCRFEHKPVTPSRQTAAGRRRR